MNKKISLLITLATIILYSKIIYAIDYKNIEIFDPKQNLVVKVYQSNTEINNMVVDWIKNINGVYGKLNPLKDDGYSVRIPLSPSIQAHSKWLDATVNEVYVIIPINSQPFFMIFEAKNKLVCFPFTGDIDALSKSLDFKLK